jgi:hypothetical protein
MRIGLGTAMSERLFWAVSSIDRRSLGEFSSLTAISCHWGCSVFDRAMAHSRLAD